MSFDQQNLLSTLNDDCIYKILELLTLDDLCLFSRTCKGLQALCKNHFKRKFSHEFNKKVEVLVGSDGTLKYDNYVKYFNRFIRKLRIVAVTTPNHNKHVVDFVKAKCSPKLHQIAICGDMELVSFGQEIETSLRNVRIVRLESRKKRCRDESIFLSCCPKLMTISLYPVESEENIAGILENTYPKLECFHWQFVSPNHLNGDKLKSFLQKNCQLQCLEWRVEINNRHLGYEVAKRINTVVDFAANLEHLYLGIDEKLIDSFGQICGHLKVLCDRDTFKSLHLQFYGIQLLKIHGYRLAILKKFTKIFLKWCPAPIDLEKALRPLGYLKAIVVHSFNDLHNDEQWSTVDELITLVNRTYTFQLPKIEEISIESENDKKILSLLMYMVRHCVCLKKVTISKSKTRLFNDTFTVAKIDRTRMKLKNAGELTIYTNNCVRSGTKNLDHKLVKVKCVI